MVACCAPKGGRRRPAAPRLGQRFETAAMCVTELHRHASTGPVSLNKTWLIASSLGGLSNQSDAPIRPCYETAQALRAMLFGYRTQETPERRSPSQGARRRRPNSHREIR